MDVGAVLKGVGEGEGQVAGWGWGRREVGRIGGRERAQEGGGEGRVGG